MNLQRPNFRSRVVSRTLALALALAGCLGVGSDNRTMQAIAYGLLCGAIGAGVAGELVGEGDEAEALGYWQQERARSIAAQRQAALLSNKLRSELESKVQAQALQLSSERETIAGLELELERLHKIQRWTVQNNAPQTVTSQPATASDPTDYQQAIQGQFIRVYRARLFTAVRRSTAELEGAIAAELNKTRDRNDTALQKLQTDLSNKLRGDWLRWVRSLDWLPHESMRSVLMDCCDVGEQIAGELSSFKVKFRNSLNVGERRELKQLREQHRSTVKQQLTETLATVSDLDGQRQELEETWTAVATDAEQQIANLIGEVERLRLELAREQQRTKAPILWEPAIGQYQQAGNAIITAMAREGVIFHRGLIRSQDWQATLAFHNVSSAALEALNSHSEAIQNLTASLCPVTFSRAHTGLIECTVQLAEKPTASALPRFCKGDDAFSQMVKALNQKATCYVMGASGAGKSSVVRLMLDEIAKSTSTIIHLHDPLDGSSEDRWRLSKRSITATATADALSILSQRMQAHDFATMPTLHIFDEIDLAMGLENEGAAVKKALLKVAKTIRHAKAETAIVIGQSPTVGGKGMQWADVDNFSALYVGGSASHAIAKSPRLLGKKSELLAQFSELEAYCQSRNRAESIDPNAAHAWRFALASIEGEPAQWYLLPPFTSDYSNRSNLLDSGIQRSGLATDSAINSQAETVALSEFPALSESPSSISPIAVAEKLDSAPICPSCGTVSDRRKGRQGKRWHCDNSECDRKSFTAR